MRTLKFDVKEWVSERGKLERFDVYRWEVRRCSCLVCLGVYAVMGQKSLTTEEYATVRRAMDNNARELRW